MRVLSLDPRIGYAIIDNEEDRFHVLHFDTLNSQRFPKDIRKDVYVFGPGLIFFSVTQEYLIEIIEKYRPDFVVTEDAFHQPGRTAAFRSLSSWISFVAWVLYTNFKKYLYSVSPKEVKKIITKRGDAKKENIKESLDIFPNLTFADHLDLTALTEHSRDAIGIGIAFITMEKK